MSAQIELLATMVKWKAALFCGNGSTYLLMVKRYFRKEVATESEKRRPCAVGKRAMLVPRRLRRGETKEMQGGQGDEDIHYQSLPVR